MLELFGRSRTNPPSKKELVIQTPDSDGVVRFMCQQNMLIELSEGVLFKRKHYDVIRNQIIDFLRSKGTISIQQVRSFFGFSWKYILLLLSKLDEERVTRYEGDEMVLAQRCE